MLHCSWDMVCDGCNYFSFWAIFCPFTPLTARKVKIKKKKKKKTPEDIIILHMCTKNYDHMITSWDTVHDRCNCYFSFWAILCSFTPPSSPPNSPKNQNFKKMKKHLRYHHFTYVYHKLWSDDVSFLRYGVWQTDRRMDGKSNI